MFKITEGYSVILTVQVELVFELRVSSTQVTFQYFKPSVRLEINLEVKFPELATNISLTTPLIVRLQFNEESKVSVTVKLNKTSEKREVPELDGACKTIEGLYKSTLKFLGRGLLELILKSKHSTVQL